MTEKGADYADEDIDSSKEHWEWRLRQDIGDAGLALRMGSTSINWTRIRQEAEDLDIDLERVGKIVDAALAGFNWDDAVISMEKRGLDRESAEEVAHRIAIQIGAGHTLHDSAYLEAQERKKLILSIFSIVLIVVAVGLGAIYWQWLIITVDTVGRCMRALIP